MFGKRPPTLLGPASAFRGTVECSEDMQIDGRYEGTIHSTAAVTVGVSGDVTGDIVADSVTVGGRIEGAVVARQRLHMLSTGSITGDASYGMLEVDRGGVIEGRAINMSGNGAAHASLPPPRDTFDTPLDVRSEALPSSHPPPAMDDDAEMPRETTKQFAPALEGTPRPSGVTLPGRRRQPELRSTAAWEEGKSNVEHDAEGDDVG